MTETKILLIDDDKIVLKTIEKLLIKEGYQLTIAESGQTAIELVKNYFYNLIITDIRMPQSDGIEIIKKVRKLQETNVLKSKFMVITGYSDTDVLKEAALMGIKYLLMKPFDRDLFLKAVDECLGGGQISLEIQLSADNKTLIDDFIEEWKEKENNFSGIKSCLSSAGQIPVCRRK